MGITKEALRRKKAITADHYVPADEEQAMLLAKAEQAMALSNFAGSEEEKEKAKAELDEVRSAIKETGLWFHITSVGRKRFDELLLEHPPTPEVKADGGTFDPATFWPAIFAESIEGDLTPDDWKAEVLDNSAWGPAEVKDLKDKVFAVHTTSRVAELGN